MIEQGANDQIASAQIVISLDFRDIDKGKKGYGFVQFDNEESTKKTIEHLNGMLLNNKQTHVDHFICKQERDTSSSKINFNNALAKNFLESTTGEDLNMIQSLVLQ
ncbi:hypothetical protein GQ457_10G000100 [Hibiscus cannabinus]